MHSSGFSRSKIAPGTSSSFSFTFSHFFFSIPPSILLFWAVWTLLKHSTPLSACLFTFAPPPNNPINGSAPSLGPRLSLFSEVSYYKKLVGAFHSTQKSGNFGWFIKWNGPFRFGPTGIFGTSFEGGPLWPVWSFRSVGPKCPFPFAKLLFPVPLFSILLTRTSIFQWKVKCSE